MTLDRLDSGSGEEGPTHQATLVPLDGAPSGVVRLGAAPLLIGRTADCTLECRDPSLSRKHAQIVYSGESWWLEDLESVNGTTVDGHSISKAELEAGNVIGFGGQVFFRFDIEVSEATARSSFWASIFCLQLVPEEGGSPFILRRRLSVVGRNASADLRLKEGQVSGIHARIICSGGKVLLRDTGSRNGTSINGKVVRQAVLNRGDRVVFGDVAFTVKPAPLPTGRAWTSSGISAVTVAALVVLASVFLFPRDELEPLWTREMYLGQVETSLVAAIRAHDRSPPAHEVARVQLNIARRSLIAADILRPDRQTTIEIQEAVRKAAEVPSLIRLLRGRDIIEVLEILERKPEVSITPPPDVEEFNLAAELSSLVAEFGIDTRDTPIPEDLVDEVERFAEFWSVDKRDFTLGAIARGQKYLGMMKQELRGHRLPEIFCYLPFIESGYEAAIISSAGARGLWQFMPGTANDYGLRVDGQMDQRTDPTLSTQAACKHLDYLLEIFGPNSFMCAIAAYNKGHNGMHRCLKRGGNLQATWKFWMLTQVDDGCLPMETVNYVPKFLSAVIVLRNPEAFGLAIPE